MNFTLDILIFSECIISILLITLVVLQKSSEVEPMISTSSKNSINKGDHFLLSFIKILIFLFFVNTITLTFINFKVS